MAKPSNKEKKDGELYVLIRMMLCSSWRLIPNLNLVAQSLFLAPLTASQASFCILCQTIRNMTWQDLLEQCLAPAIFFENRNKKRE
jgi:hypothetical protein